MSVALLDVAFGLRQSLPQALQRLASGRAPLGMASVLVIQNSGD